MNEVIVGLGSNIDPQKNIKKAREILKGKYSVILESRFIQTKPVGLVNQADFINGAILMRTELELNDLDSQLKLIEKALGRETSVQKFGPRTIDLDIIIWNKEIIDKDFYEREFLKNSVLELIPNLQIPNK